jgi:hypothetical protein
LIKEKPKKNYVNNADFFAALCEHRKKVLIAKAAHKKAVQVWKKEIKEKSKAFPKEQRKMLKDAWEMREINEEWSIDITKVFGLPQEPKYVGPKINDYIGKCVMLIASGMNNYWKFVRYTNNWKDEMSADGIEACILRLDNFDPGISKNPFAYFSQICYNASIARIKKEKNEGITKSEMIKNSGILDSLGSEQQDGDDAQYYNSFLGFLKDNLINETSEADKEEVRKKFKRSTKAHQKAKLKEQELADIPTIDTEFEEPDEDDDSPLMHLNDEDKE